MSFKESSMYGIIGIRMILFQVQIYSNFIMLYSVKSYLFFVTKNTVFI